MEKRSEKRINTRQVAKICGKLGVVNNVSDKGVQLATVFSPKSRQIDISFETSGKMIKLMGIIQWV